MKSQVDSVRYFTLYIYNYISHRDVRFYLKVYIFLSNCKMSKTYAYI